MNQKSRLLVLLLQAFKRVRQKYQTRDKRRGRKRRKRAARLRRRARERALVESLKNKPCKDCGLFYGVRHMEFDHLPGFEKTSSVGGHHRSYQKTIEEAAKCDVVCCPCHERREAARGREHGRGWRTGKHCPNLGLMLTPIPWPSAPQEDLCRPAAP